MFAATVVAAATAASAVNCRGPVGNQT